MDDDVRQAFLSARDGFSTDRVVADPDLNARYVEACRSRGLSEPALDLNRRLLNFRKAGKLAGIGNTQRTSFSDEPEYRFAAEIAVRFMERKHQTTLDRVICDPTLAGEFDGIAAKIAPGYTPLQFRWAALGLRKRRRLAPERIAHVAPSIKVAMHEVRTLDADGLPASQGLYHFLDSEAHESLYVGESGDLRGRIAKHLDHSDNKGLARWLWQHGDESLWLELHVLPAGTPVKVRRALEFELIQSRGPVFNVLGTSHKRTNRTE